MHFCSVVLALVPVLLLLAKADASTNATASPTPLRAFSSAGNRPGTLISGPFTARDEERVHGIDEFAWGNKFAVLAAKAKQAFLKHDSNSQLELKVAWWRVTNVNPRKVYIKLKLDKDDDCVLFNPRFPLWYKYVKSYNLEHPKKEVSVIDELEKHYGDYSVMLMLEQAKREENADVKAIGATLQNEQMNAWMVVGYPPKLLYNYLRSHWNPPHLLSGRAYDVWNLYFTKVNHIRSMSLFDKMYQTFGDEELPLLLSAANQPQTGALTPRVEELTTQLQLQLEQYWLDKRVPPQLVFENLKLDKHPTYLLDRREIDIWMRYAKRFWERYRKVNTLYEAIGSCYTINEILSILEKVRSDDGKKLATALKKEMALKFAKAFKEEMA